MLDSVLFLDDRSTSGAFNLANKYTELVAKKGKYPIKYRVYHTIYITNVVTLFLPFVNTVVDPCENDASISKVALQNQVYTITAAAKDYQIPAYVVSPVWCDITYTYTVNSILGGAAVSFNAE